MRTSGPTVTSARCRFPRMLTERATVAAGRERPADPRTDRKGFHRDDAVPPRTFAALTGLRAVAAVWVVIYHGFGPLLLSYGRPVHVLGPVLHAGGWASTSSSSSAVS